MSTQESSKFEMPDTLSEPVTKEGEQVYNFMQELGEKLTEGKERRIRKHEHLEPKTIDDISKMHVLVNRDGAELEIALKCARCGHFLNFDKLWRNIEQKFCTATAVERLVMNPQPSRCRSYLGIRTTKLNGSTFDLGVAFDERSSSSLDDQSQNHTDEPFGEVNHQ